MFCLHLRLPLCKFLGLAGFHHQDWSNVGHQERWYNLKIIRRAVLNQKQNESCMNLVYIPSKITNRRLNTLTVNILLTTPITFPFFYQVAVNANVL
jgi:hypothetical protein